MASSAQVGMAATPTSHVDMAEAIHNLNNLTNYKALTRMFSEFAANNMGTLTSVLEQGAHLLLEQH